MFDDGPDVAGARKPAVLITRMLPSPVMDHARRSFSLLQEQPPEDLPDRDRLLKLVREAEGLVCLLTEKADRELIDAAPRLRVIGNVAVGYENVDVGYARSRGIEVTHTPGVLTDTTAELTVALILAVTRRVVEADRFLRDGRFTCWGPTMMLGTDIRGKRIGLVGLGRIGRAVAARLSGFDAELVYADPVELDAEEADRLGLTRLPLERLIRTADVISIHVPLTPETRHLISAEAFRAMKEGAYLVNTARGPVVDEAALVAALEAGRLAGAGLDVYENEPEVHPGLPGRDDVVLLPHIGSATTETRVKMGMMALADTAAVLAGKPAQHPVPRE